MFSWRDFCTQWLVFLWVFMFMWALLDVLIEGRPRFVILVLLVLSSVGIVIVALWLGSKGGDE